MSPKRLRIVANRSLNPSAVCNCVSLAAVEAEGLLTAAVEFVPGADGFVLGAEGSCRSLG